MKRRRRRRRLLRLAAPREGRMPAVMLIWLPSSCDMTSNSLSCVSGALPKPLTSSSSSSSRSCLPNSPMPQNLT